jgi:hypothetical protein
MLTVRHVVWESQAIWGFAVDDEFVKDMGID